MFAIVNIGFENPVYVGMLLLSRSVKENTDLAENLTARMNVWANGAMCFPPLDGVETDEFIARQVRQALVEMVQKDQDLKMAALRSRVIVHHYPLNVG